MADLTYQYVLIQLINANSFHEFLPTLQKKLSRHFGRHGQGSSLLPCFAVDSEPSVQ